MPPTTPLSSVAFRLHIAGSFSERQLSERFAELGLKPKHVALLSALHLGAPGSQSDLAAILRIAPSLVVVLADDLEELGAVTRERDTVDRRRQQLALTAEGRRLLEASVRISEGIDSELLQGMSEPEQASVASFLARFAGAAGIPADE